MRFGHWRLQICGILFQPHSSLHREADMRKAHPYLLLIVIGISLAVLSGCAPGGYADQPASCSQLKQLQKKEPTLPITTEAPAEANPPSAPVSQPTLVLMNTQAAPAASSPTEDNPRLPQDLSLYLPPHPCLLRSGWLPLHPSPLHQQSCPQNRRKLKCISYRSNGRYKCAWANRISPVWRWCQPARAIPW